MTSKTDKRRRGKLQEPKPIKNAPFPVWAPLLIMLAVIITGLVLGFEANAVTTAFFAIFAVAAIVVTLLVEVRGLFLTVAALPMYFVFGTIIVGWFSTPKNANSGKRTLILNAMYPAISHFLWLAIPFVACLVIAIVRWWIYREEMSRHAAYQDLMRRRRESNERSNLDSYARVRSGRENRTNRAARTENDEGEASSRRAADPAVGTSVAEGSSESTDTVEHAEESSLTEGRKSPLMSLKDAVKPASSRSAIGEDDEDGGSATKRTDDAPRSTFRIQRREPIKKREPIKRRELDDDSFRLTDD